MGEISLLHAVHVVVVVVLSVMFMRLESVVKSILQESLGICVLCGCLVVGNLQNNLNFK